MSRYLPRVDLFSRSWTALRSAVLVDPSLRVGTQEMVLTAGDYLSAYVLEWTMHHLDLIAHLPQLADPPAEGLRFLRAG